MLDAKRLTRHAAAEVAALAADPRARLVADRILRHLPRVKVINACEVEGIWRAYAALVAERQQVRRLILAAAEETSSAELG